MCGTARLSRTEWFGSLAQRALDRGASCRLQRGSVGLRHKGERGESSAGIKASGMGKGKGEYQTCRTHDVSIRPTQDCGATVAVAKVKAKKTA
jgi:hypothetical protein